MVKIATPVVHNGTHAYTPIHLYVYIHKARKPIFSRTPIRHCQGQSLTYQQFQTDAFTEKLSKKRTQQQHTEREKEESLCETAESVCKHYGCLCICKIGSYTQRCVVYEALVHNEGKIHRSRESTISIPMFIIYSLYLSLSFHCFPLHCSPCYFITASVFSVSRIRVHRYTYFYVEHRRFRS